MSLINALRDLLVLPFDAATSRQYNACVAAARQPALYQAGGVPDTVDGRFDLVLLHVLLLMLRLRDEAANQKLFDLMFADMDRSLREMGVGDMGMARRMKPMLSGFYGRANAYRPALENTDDAALVASLSRNVYGLTEDTAPAAPILAAYVRRAQSALASQTDADLKQGRLSFPVFAPER